MTLRLTLKMTTTQVVETSVSVEKLAGMWSYTCLMKLTILLMPSIHLVHDMLEEFSSRYIVII